MYIPSSPLRLVCLVSRTIVKENIPYFKMDIVPTNSKKFIALHDSHCCVYSSKTYGQLASLPAHRRLQARAYQG